MKKYLFGILAIAIAVGFSAFTTPKKTTSRFVINQTPVLASTVTDVIPSGGGISQAFYANWEVSASSCTGALDEQACAIEVDQQYTHLESGTRVLNAATSGSAVAFPMSAALGYDNANNSLDRYKVTTTETALIDVTNKTHN